MAQDQILDLLGADLLAAAVDEVLLATFDHVVAGRMFPQQVTASVKAVGGERTLVVLGGAEVAAQRVRAARQQFADLAVGHIVIVLVDQAHLVVRADRAPAGLQSDVGRVVQPVHVIPREQRMPRTHLREDGGADVVTPKWKRSP